MKLTKSQEAKAKTSLNQVPSLINKTWDELGPTNIDIGGGKYEKCTEFLANKGILNLVYDPYNRSKKHNDFVMNIAQSHPVDTITCASVLNVIKSKSERGKLLNKIRGIVAYQYAAHRRDVKVFFTTYEKNGDGIEDPTLPQTNMKTKSYLPEIKKHFPDFNVTLKNKVIRVELKPIEVKSVKVQGI